MFENPNGFTLKMVEVGRRQFTHPAEKKVTIVHSCAGGGQ
jgi:hypothetical protein